MTHASNTRGGPVTLSKEGLPDWLAPVVRAVETVQPVQLSRFLPPEGGGGRQAAVLILFGEGARGPGVSSCAAAWCPPGQRRGGR